MDHQGSPQCSWAGDKALPGGLLNPLWQLGTPSAEPHQKPEGEAHTPVPSLAAPWLCGQLVPPGKDWALGAVRYKSQPH